MENQTLFISLTGASLIIPLLFIYLILLYRTSIPYSRGIRSAGAARSEQFIPFLGMDLKTYVALYAYLSFFFQLTSMAILAMLEFNNKSSVPVSQEMEFGLFAIWVLAGSAQLALMFIVVLVFLYDVPNRLDRTPAPEFDDLTSWQQQSEDFASINMTRFENQEKTVIFANCSSNYSGTAFKLAFVQEKKDSRTNCYAYEDDNETLKKINPTPMTVDELENIFNSDQE